MRRSASPLHYLAVMSQQHRSSIQGREIGREVAWNTIRRCSSYSNNGSRYVTGDEHFQSVRELNLGLREKEDGNECNQTASFSQRGYFPNNPRGRRQSALASRPRQWDHRVWQFSKAPPTDAVRFVVLSYNILADSLGNEHREKLYRHIPSYIMEWNWRKKSILFELNLWSPDIMCFQEVDRFEDFDEPLKQRGYSGVWKRRTGSAVDGCAVFWRTSRFKLIQEESIEFNQFGLRHNVAQICVFEFLNSSSSAAPLSSGGLNKVVICNIHVLYNPRRGEYKLGQVRLLLERARATSILWNNAPVVLCGDFNCTPKSPLYNFIASQKLNLTDVDRVMVSGQATATVPFPRGQNSSITEGKEDATCTEIASPLDLENRGEDASSITEGKDDATCTEIASPHDVENRGEDASSESNVREEMSNHGSDMMTTDSESTAHQPPTSWTPGEIAIATGGELRTTLEHRLLLSSTYTEVEDVAGTRDSSGEPLATSCNRCFFGTVDYIWRSEGLQTVKVLAPLTKQSMQQTRGFPTKKWGSDHIALVSELAFTAR